MHIKRILLILMLVAVSVALTVLVTASTTQAAAGNFGLLIKPGWNGTNGKMADGNVAVVKCALQHTSSRSVIFPASTYVYTNVQGVSCAKVPLGFWVWPAGVKYDPAWEEVGSMLGVPIPNSWP